MSIENDLTEIELKLFLESRSKTIEEISKIYNMDLKEISEIIERAKGKILETSVEIKEGDSFLPRPVAYRLEEKIGEPQLGTMKVGSKILEMLSKGIYTAPWNSLKELINNSFDADAEKVDINYIKNEKKLIIKDTGIGMNYKDFDENFTFIVRSSKRDFGDYSNKYSRPLIGKIGIGFIAVSELCDKIIITSSKENSDIYFIATIDFSKIISKEHEKKEFYEVSQFTLTNYKKKNISDHYTIIELINLKQNFIDILENNSEDPTIILLEYKPKNYEELISNINKSKSVRSSLGPYWEFIINLSNIIPVKYLDNGPISFEKIKDIKKGELEKLNLTKNIIENIQKKLISYNFIVTFDGLELKKPILLPHQEEVIRHGVDYYLIPVKDKITIKNEFNETDIIYHGYFYNQRTRILPEELRGFIIRIKNVAIGGASQNFWGHPYPGDTTYFLQTYGEIYIESGLEDAMNIDRSTFKTTHDEFYRFQNVIHKFLRKEVFQQAKTMYKLRREEKSEFKDIEREKARTESIEEYFGQNYILSEIRNFKDPPAKLDEKNEMIIINQLSTPIIAYKKEDRYLLQDVSIALEYILKDLQDKDKIREKFWTVLNSITKYR